MKTVIVTGASTGIGKAAALEFAKTGATVLLVARSEEKLNQVKQEVEKLGGTAEVFVCDLSSQDAVEKLIEDIKSKYLEISAICNIAAVWHGEDEAYAAKNFDQFDKDVIKKSIDVGITAPMLLVNSLVALMPKESMIINLSGTFIYGGKGQLPYYVSKRAIEDFTIALADELKEKDVYVNCVSPADTLTESYAKFFPEDITDAQPVENISKFINKLFQEKVSGKIFLIRNGKIDEEGFHK